VVDKLSKSGNILWQEGMELLKNKKFQLSLEKFTSALNFYEEQGDDMGVSSCYLGLGLVNTSIGNFKEALTYLNKGHSIAEKINFKPGVASFLMNRGLLFQKLKKFDDALRDFEKSLQIFEDLNNNNSVINLRLFIKNCEKDKSRHENLTDLLRKK
jgi:tetratricopeptide (TPR) repeat protein